MEAEFPPSPRSVPEARHWTRRVLTQWGLDGEADFRHRAELLVTELASNAVIHADSAFRLRLELHGGCLRGEIRDRSSERPRLMNFAPEATAGRGLAIVERLSRNTGVDVQNGSKIVWFELQLGGDN